MLSLKFKSLMLLPAAIFIAWGIPGWSAQQTTQPGKVPVNMVVSVEAKHGNDVQTVGPQDVRVLQGSEKLQVTNWVPLQGDKAGLELFVLVDESDNSDVSLQFNDLRQFFNNQPTSTSIAIGYMRYGDVDVVQKFTTDRAQSGKALRIPLNSAGISGSPYLSVSDLIKHWPESSSRREIFLISSGVDRLSGGPSDPYLDEAISQAQRAGIQVYAIYTPAEGHFGHSFFRINWGQNNLAELTEETGGEFYSQSFAPVSFKPFLEQFAERLKHQYLLTFQIKAENKPKYQHVRVETEVPNADLVAADKVYVPAVK